PRRSCFAWIRRPHGRPGGRRRMAARIDAPDRRGRRGPIRPAETRLAHMTTYRARWVLPITAPAIENGSVTVENGRITQVGQASPKGAMDLGDAILMPGLVNAHCHLELTVMRGFLEDLDFRRWILRLTSARRAVLDRDAMLDSARYGLEEGVRAGVTTYADTCESGVVMQA